MNSFWLLKQSSTSSDFFALQKPIPCAPTGTGIFAYIYHKLWPFIVGKICQSHSEHMGYTHQKTVRCAISRSLGKAKYHSRSQAPLEGLRVSASIFISKGVGGSVGRSHTGEFFYGFYQSKSPLFHHHFGRMDFLLLFSNHLNFRKPIKQQSGKAIILVAPTVPTVPTW